LFVVGFLSRDDGCIGGKHEVDSRVGNQVGLEFSDIHIQSTIKPQRSSQGGNDLRLPFKKVSSVPSLNLRQLQN
jgi:hypothetical protein